MRFIATSPAGRATLTLALSGLFLATGCHSAYVLATVTNATNAPISPFEVDYPSASFGATTLAPGACFPYRFKILGSGQTKVLWTDAKHVDHTTKGPELHEGDEGTLAVTIHDTDATLTFTAKPKA